MKKILSLLLAAVIICLSATNAFALGILLPLKGDADGNGQITAADARLILRASVGLHTPMVFRKTLYDIDNDGKITASDARTVLRASVGLEKLPWQKETVEDVAKRTSERVSPAELDSLMKTVCDMGSRSVIFPKVNKKAADFIMDELEKSGCNPKYQKFSYNSISTGNVITTLNGNENHEEILLLSTHYDCYDGSEGAIDNASGVAALLHTVKILKESNISFKKEIRIAFFSAEEMGYHGAYHYLASLSQDEKNKLTVFNIDMAGNSLLGGGTLLCVSTKSAYGNNAKDNEISLSVDKAKAFMGKLGESEYYSPIAAGLHDLIPFEKAGIPAATLSWREIRPDGSHGSDYGIASPSQIHTSLDTYENFNTQSLYNTTKLIVNTLVLNYLSKS